MKPPPCRSRHCRARSQRWSSDCLFPSRCLPILNRKKLSRCLFRAWARQATASTELVHAPLHAEGALIETGSRLPRFSSRHEPHTPNRRHHERRGDAKNRVIVLAGMEPSPLRRLHLCACSDTSQLPGQRHLGAAAGGVSAVRQACSAVRE